MGVGNMPPGPSIKVHDLVQGWALDQFLLVSIAGGLHSLHDVQVPNLLLQEQLDCLRTTALQQLASPMLTGAAIGKPAPTRSGS